MNFSGPSSASEAAVLTADNGLDRVIGGARSTVESARSDVQGFHRKHVLALIDALTGCRVTVVEGDRHFHLGQPRNEHDLACTVVVKDEEFWRAVVTGGSVAVGETFMNGLWEVDDPVALVRIFVRNRDVLDRMETGLARLGGLLFKAWHAFRRNTKIGSKKNIEAHYDLGNALFRTFLDDNLMYSSAIYANPTESLEVASRRKLDRICQKLGLGPQHHVVEIGTGWGGFALHAAGRYGCRVTTTTISEEQFALATERVAAARLSDRITVVKRDYRDLEGKFDRLVSIEMIEAIGHQYLDTYFAKVGSLLKPDGMALIQAITIEDHRYERALANVDFIQRYIFPGSFIPAVGAMTGAIARSTDLRLYNLEDIGPSYALTLREWRRRFNAARDEVLKLGYPDRFTRLWNWYLAYCEGGFMERSIGNAQMLLVKPDCRAPEYLPGLSAP